MLPPAPTRFSAITGWPQTPWSFAATARPTMSVELPGVNAMISRTGFVGYALCANAAPAARNAAHPAASSLRQPISDLHFLWLKFDSRRLRLHHEQRGEVLLGQAVADHLLDQVARQRGERHRHFEPAARVEPQVHVLAQEVRRERHLEVEVDERRRLVPREGRAHYALVQEVEEAVPGHARLLREDRDLGERLGDDAEQHVVADLGDPRQLALADVARALPHQVEERARGLIRGFRAGNDERELARLDDLGVPAHRRGEGLDPARGEDRAELRRPL